MGSNDYSSPKPKNPARYLFDNTGSKTAPRPIRDIPGDELAEAFTAAGWQDLNNARATISVEGREISLVGTADAHLDEDRFPAHEGRKEGGDGSSADRTSVRLGVNDARRAVSR